MPVRSTFRRILQALAAFTLTIASAFIAQRDDIEVGIYGNMGSLYENVRSRVVGGWPAPFMADSVATSVPFKLGAEDKSRSGPFLASLAFWYLALAVPIRIVGWLRRRSRPAKQT